MTETPELAWILLAEFLPVIGCGKAEAFPQRAAPGRECFIYQMEEVAGVASSKSGEKRRFKFLGVDSIVFPEAAQQSFTEA